VSVTPWKSDELCAHMTSSTEPEYHIVVRFGQSLTHKQHVQKLISSNIDLLFKDMQADK